MSDRVGGAAAAPWWVTFWGPIATCLLVAGVPMGFLGLVTIRGRKSGSWSPTEHSDVAPGVPRPRADVPPECIRAGALVGCHSRGCRLVLWGGRYSSMKELMMNRALWIVAGLLAVIYLLSGAGKLIVPKEKLAAFPGAGWVDDFSAGAVKAIGALEVLAAVGLILP
ncbi:MAG: DoxX family protein, partial [Thermomicrobiales bacterium]